MVDIIDLRISVITFLRESEGVFESPLQAVMNNAKERVQKVSTLFFDMTLLLNISYPID